MTVLALDISGAFHEGKGVTGWCTMTDRKLLATGIVSAINHKTDMTYYRAILDLITRMALLHHGTPFTVVIEDYLLYGHKAAAQTNSHMETSQLLGIVKYFCWEHGITYTTQRAVDVKNRWTDDILIHAKIDLPHYKNSKHVRDAIRHAMHYTTFYKGD